MNTRECFFCKLLFPFWKLGKRCYITFSRAWFLLILCFPVWHVQNVNVYKKQSLSVPEQPLLAEEGQEWRKGIVIICWPLASWKNSRKSEIIAYCTCLPLGLINSGVLVASEVSDLSVMCTQRPFRSAWSSIKAEGESSGDKCPVWQW